MSTTGDDKVLVAIKTPLMPRAATALLPAKMTLAESLDEFQKMNPNEDNERRVVQQLERETSGVYELLVVNQTGEISRADPKTSLQEIAVPREIRTSRGLEKIPTAAFEVQAYASVGR